MLRICRYGNPILRGAAREVSSIGQEDIQLMGDMIETMCGNEGVGLAAPQVGVDKRIVVLDVDRGVQRIINPIILHKEGVMREKEGCLSIPGVFVEVERAACVTIQGINEKGEEITIDAEGLLSRVLQHEIDHLNGMLIVDYASPAQRIMMKKKLKELREPR